MASKQDCKVFVGGLSWETTDQKLRLYFENWGNVTEAFVSYDRNTGRPRGFGFVVFEDPGVADKVVVQQHTIDRREVEAKKAVPKEEHQAKKSTGEVGSQRSKKIFVGGLAPSVDEKAFREYFDQYGPVKDAVVMYDHENKRPRGFGFVTFVDEEAVAKVFTNGVMQTLHDKKIEIKHAVPRDQMAAQRGGGGAAGGFGARGGFGAGRGAAGGYYHNPQFGLANPGGYGPRGGFAKYGGPGGRGALLGGVGGPPGGALGGGYRGMGAASRGVGGGMGLNIGGGMGRGMGAPMGGSNMGGLNNMQTSFASSLPAYGASGLGYGGMNSAVLSFPATGNGLGGVGGGGGGFASMNGYTGAGLAGGPGGMGGPGPQDVGAGGIGKAAFGGLGGPQGGDPGGYAQFSPTVGAGLQGGASGGLVGGHETELDARTLSLNSNAASATSGYKMLDEGHAFSEGPAPGWSS